MPIHDWTRVPAGIFHHFHHAWIERIHEALNGGLLPDDYYALAEQVAAGVGPDVLTLQARDLATNGAGAGATGRGSGSTTLIEPKARFRVSCEEILQRKRKSKIVIRHVSDDRIIAILEILSPGNKAGKAAFREFIEKVIHLLNQGIHLLLIDLFPPTPRDPQGIHRAIWQEISDNEHCELPTDKPLTLAAYECDLGTIGHIEPVAVGDVLPNMPLILAPRSAVEVPLEATYQAAFAVLPRRWQRELE